MRKLLFLSAALLQLGHATAQTSNAAPYCKPVFQNTAAGNTISSVNLTSLGSGTNASGSTNTGYMFYNNIAPIQLSVIKGSMAYNFIGPIGLTQSSGTDQAQTLSVFIDFNHDGKFDASEGHRNTPALGMGAIYPYIPSASDTSYYGLTRMRVIWTNESSSSSDPCNSSSSFSYNGETEDYLANITNTLPIVKATGATNITGNAATLNGSVYVNGLNAAATAFEYGQTTAYTNAIIGSSVPADTSGTIKTLTTNISGLNPFTIYHYRTKAYNGKDTIYSKDQMFVTTAPTGITNANTSTAIVVSRLEAHTIKVQGLLANHNYTLTLTDISGKVIANGAITNDEIMRLQDLSTGIYFLRIVSTSDNSLLFRDKLLF